MCTRDGRAQALEPLFGPPPPGPPGPPHRESDTDDRCPPPPLRLPDGTGRPSTIMKPTKEEQRRFIAALCKVAWADGVVQAEERSHLHALLRRLDADALPEEPSSTVGSTMAFPESALGRPSPPISDRCSSTRRCGSRRPTARSTPNEMALLEAVTARLYDASSKGDAAGQGGARQIGSQERGLIDSPRAARLDVLAAHAEVHARSRDARAARVWCARTGARTYHPPHAA